MTTGRVNRRESDVEDVIQALDSWIWHRFGINPRVLSQDGPFWRDAVAQDNARKELARVLIAATANPEPE